MKWQPLESVAQLESIDAKSADQAVVLFKHSTRCNISSMAKARLERSQNVPPIDFYYLDLLQFRDVSNAIAERYKVVHQSPQVLVIRNANCIFEESHNGINMEEIAEQAGF